MSVTIDISFDPALAILIADFNRVDFHNMKEPLTKIVSDVMSPSIAKNFAVGGRPKWVPLKDSTVWQRNPHGTSARGPIQIIPGKRQQQMANKRPSAGGTQLLVSTGALLAAASSPDAWTITEEDATAENLGDADYGKFHQSGTTTIPARPFFVIQDEDEDAAATIFEDWALRKLNDWGF